MKKPLFSALCLVWAVLVGETVQAQSATVRFKPEPRGASPIAAPRPDVVLDGAATQQLRQATGPRADAALLPTLPYVTAEAPAGAGVQLVRADNSGLPIFISVPAVPGAQAKGPAKGPALEAACFAFLTGLKDQLQVRAPGEEFAVLNEHTDALGQTHVRLGQRWRGLPVYGAEVLVHLDGAGRPVLFTGRYYRTPAAVTSARPAVGKDAAAAAAENALRTRTVVGPLSTAARQVLAYPGPATELVVFHPGPDAPPVLAWHVTTRPSFAERWESFVDARTGRVLRQDESSCRINGPSAATAPDLNGVARTLNTYEWNGQFYLLDGAQPMFDLAHSTLPAKPVGALLTLDAHNTDGGTLNFETSAANDWTAPAQQSAVSAHYNAAVAYNYFRTVHNRHSIDGANGTILSVVHLTKQDGSGLDNAYWNGNLMAYGEGNTQFFPLAGGLDVGGHEMTHGVVQHTANLVYQGQSGALNEHMADVFGNAMAPNTWTIGSQVVRPAAFPSGALRSLADPHNGGQNGYQPRTMAEFYTGTSDHGGVHQNSGICNWAYYKYATATSRAHGEQVWYRALTTYLTASSEFVDLRLAVLRAAGDLYGAGSADVAAAADAFTAVGILGTSPTPPTTGLPVNPGPDYVLSYNTDPTASGTFYRSTTTGTNFVRLSSTPARSRASVNDRGTVAVFVDGQGRIRSLQLTSPYTEAIVQNQPIWHSVALSKDGSRLAAVTAAADTAIYLFDLVRGQVARAHLYNPTNSAGVVGKGVRYADALEWDYSGEHVIYDAYNVVATNPITTGTGGGIEYWDIGRLSAWNNASNSWGDGTIEKLVASLPAGISIGNPVLSKRSSNILAFDYYNANGGTTPFRVMALNVETSEAGVIYAQNTVPGNPSFSKLDDQLLFTAISTAGDTVLAVNGLQSNAVQPAGGPTALIGGAKWGTWYAQGQRVLGARPAVEPLPGFAVYPNPVQDELTVETYAAAPLVLTLYDLLGRVVRTLPPGTGSRTRFSLRDLPAGTYVLRATDGRHVATRRVTKQ